MGTILIQPFELPLPFPLTLSRQKDSATQATQNELPPTTKPDGLEVDLHDQKAHGGVGGINGEVLSTPTWAAQALARRDEVDVPAVIYHRDGGRAVVEAPPAYDGSSRSGGSSTS